MQLIIKRRFLVFVRIGNVRKRCSCEKKQRFRRLSLHKTITWRIDASLLVTRASRDPESTLAIGRWRDKEAASQPAVGERFESFSLLLNQLTGSARVVQTLVRLVSATEPLLFVNYNILLMYFFFPNG